MERRPVLHCAGAIAPRGRRGPSAPAHRPTAKGAPMLLSPALPRLLPAGLLLLLAVGCVGSPAPTPVESIEPQVTERSYRTVVVDANGREDHESFVC